MNKKRTNNKSEGSKKLRAPLGNLVYPDGRPVGVLGIKRIIAERKQAEKLYKDVVELSPDSIITVDMKGVITSCNTAATRMLGFSKDEMVGKHFSKIGCLRTSDISKFSKLFGSALRGKLTKPLELTFYRKDGTSLLTEVRVGLLKEGNKIMGLQAISRDITERKLAEEALRESEEKLIVFMDSAPDGFGLFDSELNLVEINKVGLGMFPAGTKKEDVIGKNITELYPNMNETGRYDKYLEVIKNGKPFFIDDVVPHPKFGDVHLAVKAFKVGDGLGIIATNITKRKRAYDRIKLEREVYRSIARAANRSRTVEELCELALKGIQRAIKYDMADVMVYRGAENALFSAAHVGYPEDLYRRTIKRQDLKEGSKVATQATRKRKSIYINDMKTNKLTSYARDLIVKYDISTLYVVPLFNRGKLQGALEVLTTGDKKLSKEDHEVLDTISEELAGGIAKAKIEEQLVTVKDAFRWLSV